MKNFNKIFLGALCFLGIICLFQIKKRITTEQNKNIEICLDFSDFEEFAAKTNKNVFWLLKKFRDAGVNSVAVEENTLTKLVNSLKIQVLDNLSGEKILGINFKKNEFGIISKNKEILKEILNNLSFKTKKSLVSNNIQVINLSLKNKNLSKYYFLILKGDFEVLKNVGVGFSPKLLKKIKKLGLGVNFRIANESFLNKNNLDNYLQQVNLANKIKGKIYAGWGWKEENFATLIFLYAEVMGYPYLVKDVGEKLKQQNLNFALVEFAKQKGEQELGFAVRPNLVRVHSIKKEELEKFSPPVISDRILRAVNERKINLIYLRPIPVRVGKNSLKINLDFYKNLKTSLQKNGFSEATALPFSDTQLNFLTFIIMTLILTILGILILKAIFALGENFTILNFLTIIFGWFLIGQAFFLAQSLTVKLVAFFTAIIFPLLAFIFAEKEENDEISVGLYLICTFKLLKISFITLMGGLVIATILSDWSFQMGLNLFAGVKFSFLFPLIIILIIYFLNFYPQKGENFKNQIQRTYKNLIALLNLNLKLWWAAGFFIFAAVLIAMLLRTGNDPSSLVSPLELKFRALLEKILIVRPRTKEFLIGHPFLFLYFLFLKQKGKKIFPFLFVGMIGQLSLLNSFCHLHSPFILTLGRTLQGLWIGVLVGTIYYIIINLGLKLHHYLKQ